MCSPCPFDAGVHQKKSGIGLTVGCWPYVHLFTDDAVRIARNSHTTSILSLARASGSQLDLTCMCLSGRLQRPLAHARGVRHAGRASGAIVRNGGRGGTRIDRAPASSHRASTGVLRPERVRREVLVVDELQEPAEPAAPGPVRRELPDGAPVGHEEGDQVDDAAEERGGAGDEEEAPEAAEAEAVRREGAALRRAALGVAEPLALDQVQLVALCQVQDRPRQVRHVRGPLGERLLRSSSICTH
jgi:hypothetical protein